MARQLEVVDDLAGRLCIALHAEAQYAAEGVRPERLLRERIRGVGREPEVRDPCDLRVLLQPSMSLSEQ